MWGPVQWIANIWWMIRIDDGPGVQVFMELIKTLFLSMLATLERNDLLKPDSEIKNLDHIMALYIRHRVDALADFSLDPTDIEAHIFAYATKHNIDLLPDWRARTPIMRSCRKMHTKSRSPSRQRRKTTPGTGQSASGSTRRTMALLVVISSILRLGLAPSGRSTPTTRKVPWTSK